jgi:hypothetical protein
MTKLPSDTSLKYQKLVERMLEYNSFSSSLVNNNSSMNYDHHVLGMLSKRKEVYFVVDSPSFEYNNKMYNVATILSTAISEYLTKSLQEGKLFAFYSTYDQMGYSFIRGCVIDDTSDLLAQDREDKINQFLENE